MLRESEDFRLLLLAYLPEDDFKVWVEKFLKEYGAKKFWYFEAKYLVVALVEEGYRMDHICKILISRVEMWGNLGVKLSR